MSNWLAFVGCAVGAIAYVAGYCVGAWEQRLCQSAEHLWRVT